VNLGCGFDTRFWRIADQKIKYIEVDLPGVIEVKKEILGDLITYPVIGSSVLEEEWMNRVREDQTENVLFLSEGLFMYLPKEDVIRTFKKISETFSNSLMVMEVVNEKYTRGTWKKMVENKMRRRIGSTAGSSYSYGLKRGRDLEEYHQNIKVVGEWSHFEDKDFKPSLFRLLRHMRIVSRTQWTVMARIG
jgi:O-methyltransferase involved in polyketide biosynthesis